LSLDISVIVASYLQQSAFSVTQIWC